jgi:diguanylate cyclase (GGDEF)-like protein
MQNDKHDIVRALEAGAAEYLTTPFEAMELRARLMVAVRILNRQETLVTSRDRFRLLATKDPLTGLWNRRSIQQILKDELERAGQSERTTGVLLIDLDHFKNVNDTYGHLAGDFVLQEASRRLKGSLRAYDSIGRYGGEEFLIVVPAAGEAELCELAERLRKAVADVPIRVGENEIRLTLSVGAAIAPSHVNLSSDVLGGADAALYDAKRRGRNRYVYSSLKLEQGAEVCTAGPSQLACPSVGRR